MSNYVSPWDALEAIARMKITPDTNHAELCTLMIAIARRALDAAKINIIAITEAEMTDLDRFLLGLHGLRARSQVWRRPSPSWRKPA
jgi:hypothetical protein